jgi:hypothetical protein
MAVNPSVCGLTGPVIRRSIIQNELLFSSEGLTLLSLDRLYSFKSALSSYSRTGSPLRLEDAVDELRRLVLARAPGRLIPKADVLRSYEWLGVTDSALADVDKMYRRAYGGPDRTGAIEGIGSQIETEVKQEDGEMILDDEEAGLISKAMMSFRMASPPPAPKVPVLKLQTKFEPPKRKPVAAVVKEEGVVSDDDEVDDEDEEEELTARPSATSPGLPVWNNNASIDEVLSEDRGPHKLGSMTPNGYDDISPITRGEWGFLFSGGDGLGGSGRQVAVETW